MINDKIKKMLCKSLFYTCFMAALTVSGQVLPKTLKWSDSPKQFFIFDGTTKKQLQFEGAFPDEKNGFLPVFSESILLNADGKINVELQDAIYEPSPASTDELNVLKNNIEINAEVVETRKKHYAVITFYPLRKNVVGQIERLVSFKIKINQQASSNNSRGATAFGTSSVLGSGTWYKVAIQNTGIYKLDYNYFKQTLAANIDNSPFDKIGVFGNGGGMVPEKNADARFDDLQENAIQRIDNNGNNKMDADDYILFYAEGAHKWNYNSTNQLFEHQFNLYDDKNYYFVTTDKATGKGISVVNYSTAATNFVTDFDDYAFHELDEKNMIESGRYWFGDRMSYSKNTTSFSFDFPNLVAGSSAKYRSAVLASSIYTSTIALTINGANVYSTSFNGIPNNAYKPGYNYDYHTASFNLNSNQVNVTYSYSNPDQSSNSEGLIDYFSIQVKRNLLLNGNAMLFRNAASIGAGNISQFTLGAANGATKIWDVSDPTSVKEISANLSGSDLVFKVATPNLVQMAAVNINSNYSTPEKIGQVSNQDLHATPFVDNIIVTTDALVAQAQDLANFHQGRGVSTKVVTVNQIYNEFSSGKQDISAIRDFARMLYERAGTDSLLMPKYLCLFGDASYDPKNRLASNTNIVPSYESYDSQNPLGSYVSDDFYGFLSPNEGGNINSNQSLDLAVGRLPIISASEASQVVDKIINYKSTNSLGAWRNVVTTIGDDEDGGVHQREANFLAEYVRINYPNYNDDKIILDAYQQVSTPGGSRYPDVNTAILNRLNSGCLVLSYTGHGGVNNWAHERIFGTSDILALKNKNRLPLFVTATCEFSRFDDPAKKAAGEFVVTTPDGGGIGSITTVRAVFSDANDALQDALFAKLFLNNNGSKPTMGTLLMLAKNNVNTSVENTRKFVLLGDPALQLNYPEYQVITTHINNQPIAAVQDTFKALKLMTVKAQVQDWTGARLTNFNGVGNVTVFDKLATFSGLQNDIGTPNTTFNAYKNVLFKGAATVSNGEFSFSFIVPKDINYLLGDGRISYYAADPSQNLDAHGYKNDIKVGGAMDSFLLDNKGPEIDLFMNDEKFVYGGITNETPNLLVKLKDESGINTSGNGLGHDVVAVLDNNLQKQYVLNEYYESDKDSYSSGKVLYPMTKIAEGRHTLTVKAWDVQNNSAESRTEFVVAKSAKVALSKVFNYPNPFTTSTTFMFEHNRPGDQLTVMIQIYTVTGVLVKSISRDIVSEGFRVNDIKWDGLDEYGDKIGKGVYIYKVYIKDSEGNTANQFQKLVLLK